MTATTRIRWEPLAGGGAYGYVGTRATAVFNIWQYDGGGSTVQPWALKSDWLAGYATGTHPDDLKAEAERWLEEYVSSLGAVLPDEPAADDRLPLIGRDLVLVRNLAKQITDKGIRGHSYTPLSDYGMAGRGFAFEVLIHEDRKDTGRVAKVTVVLDRVEGTGS